MANVLRIDPLTVFNFYITLVDSSNLGGTLLSMAMNYFVAGFSECSLKVAVSPGLTSCGASSFSALRRASTLTEKGATP